ncbi:MAG: hypothetical protein MJZ11_12400 [Lachnospiraceae bacterium]|nr:hypothetical protein [Lachnospiraceae bacterium]
MSKTQQKPNLSLPLICSEESLIRLLCSPWYYDENKKCVNPDAFDLRVLQSGLEEFVSLGRFTGFENETDIKEFLFGLGPKIWKKDNSNSYWGYGTFKCGDALEVNDKIEIHPLQNSKSHHVGMFYKKSDNEYYRGPLPKDDIEILEMLSDLADLLEVVKVV